MPFTSAHESVTGESRPPEFQDLQAAYEKLFASVGDVSWTLSLDGRFTRMGTASMELMGRSPESLIGQPFEAILPEGELPKMKLLFRQSLKGLARGANHRVLHVDGSLRWVFTQSAPLLREGRVLGLVGASRNVSDQHELRERMAQAQKMESLGELASGLAHEFNNILVSILGFTALVREDTSGDDPNFGLLGMIEKEGRRGSRLIRRILSFARPDRVRPSSVDLCRVVREVSRICEGTLGRHVEVLVDCPGDLPPIEGDPSLLSQVLLNLALNARDAMPEGGELLFRCRQRFYEDEDCISRPGLVPGSYVELDVVDLGVGMEADVAERIFEPFYTTKARDHGTGLGLTMVYRIVKDHHGLVEVQSARGKGTTVTICLPTFSNGAGKNMPTHG